MQKMKEKENIKEQQSKAAPAMVYNPIYLQKNFRLGKYFFRLDDVIFNKKKKD